MSVFLLDTTGSSLFRMEPGMQRISAVDSERLAPLCVMAGETEGVWNRLPPRPSEPILQLRFCKSTDDSATLTKIV